MLALTPPIGLGDLVVADGVDARKASIRGQDTIGMDLIGAILGARCLLHGQ